MVTVAIQGNGTVSQTVTGRLLRLEALPDDGWQFGSWIGIPSHVNPVTIIPDAAVALGVMFTPTVSEAGTWTSTQFLFNIAIGASEGGFGPPETYTVGANGTLTSAHVTPDEAAIAVGFGADTVTVGTTTLVPGAEATLYTATGFDFELEFRGEIEVFTLTLDEDGSATWTFDYTATVVADFDGDVQEATSRLVGEQTGMLNAAGTEIDWMAISGSAIIVNPLGQMSQQSLATLGLTLGTWTRTGGP